MVDESPRPQPDAVRVDGAALLLLRLLDVGEGIDLERARAALATGRGARRAPATLRGPERGSGGVVLAAEPLELDLGATEIDGHTLATTARVFELGVVSVRFECALGDRADAQALGQLAASLSTCPEIDIAARHLAATLVRDLGDAVASPHDTDLIEDFTIVRVARVVGASTGLDALTRLDAPRLLLAEPERPLADGALETTLRRAIFYYRDDAVAIGWNTAVIVDPDGGREVIDVLEAANAHLLELRYYDALVGRELSRIYDAAAKARRGSTLLRSPYAPLARRAALVFVEMSDLYDRADRALTLVGDSYTVRLYREATERFRSGAIAASVREKLGTLSRVSEMLEGEVGRQRALLLEVAVVGLILLEFTVGLLRH